MLIRWEDKDWALDVAGLTNRQAMALETEMGMSIAEFYDLLGGDEDDEGFDSAKPYFLKLMTILYWLMLDQNGVRVKITDVEFPLIPFAQAVSAASAAEAAAQLPAVNGAARPGPTRRPRTSAPSRARSSRTTTTTAAGSPDG